MNFEFATATRIIFGAGSLGDLGTYATSLGHTALLVTNAISSTRSLLDALKEHQIDALALLQAKGMPVTVYSVSGEPTVDALCQGLKLARQTDCDLVIGLGGGSAIDTAKAISALLANGGEPLDYLEVIGRGKPLLQPSLPWIAVPTTAGTGAEVTANAVIESPEHSVKTSLRSPQMLARLALVDAELTYYLPPAVTASTGLDALTQVIEPFTSNKANPLTDALCREGMAHAAHALHRVYENSQKQVVDPAGREELCLTSLFGGLALANAKLGAVHGFAGPLGGIAHAAHGAICACLLPQTLEVNVRTLRQRDPASAALDRFSEAAQILTGKTGASIDDGIAWIKELTGALHIPSLSTLGVKKSDFPLLIEKAAASSSMKGNPVQLTHEEMAEILEKAW